MSTEPPPMKQHLWPTTILPRRLDLSPKGAPGTPLVAQGNTSNVHASSLQLFSTRQRASPFSDNTLSHTHDISKGGAQRGGAGGFPLQQGGSSAGPGSLAAMSASPGSTATRAGHSVHSAHSANVSSEALSVATPKSSVDVHSPLGHGHSTQGMHGANSAVVATGVSALGEQNMQLAHASDVWKNVSGRGTSLAFSPPAAAPMPPHRMNRNISHQTSLNARAARSSSISDASTSQSRGNTTSMAGNTPGMQKLESSLLFLYCILKLPQGPFT